VSFDEVQLYQCVLHARPLPVLPFEEVVACGGEPDRLVARVWAAATLPTWMFALAALADPAGVRAALRACAATLPARYGWLPVALACVARDGPAPLAVPGVPELAPEDAGELGHGAAVWILEAYMADSTHKGALALRALTDWHATRAYHTADPEMLRRHGVVSYMDVTRRAAERYYADLLRATLPVPTWAQLARPQ